jgi:uncharacterized protein
MVRVDYDTQTYWKGCAEKKLVIARCSACAHWIHPPKAVCPKCWSTDITHVERSGQAHVFTFTEIPQKGGGEPRTTIWAQLDDADVLVMGELQEGCGSISIDDPLTMTWNTLEDTFVPAFRKSA